MGALQTSYGNRNFRDSMEITYFACKSGHISHQLDNVVGTQTLSYFVNGGINGIAPRSREGCGENLAGFNPV